MTDVANQGNVAAAERVHWHIRLAVACGLQIHIRPRQRAGAQRAHIHHHTPRVVLMQHIHQRRLVRLGVPVVVPHFDSQAIFAWPCRQPAFEVVDLIGTVAGRELKEKRAEASP